MKHFFWVMSAPLLSQVLTPGLPAGLFSNNALASSNNGDSNSTYNQTNIRGQQEEAIASAPVDSGFTFDGSFLYWNAKVDGYQFAETLKLKGLNPGSGPVSINAKGKLITPQFDNWDPGLQLGIGYVFPQREQWHARLSWTHFDTDNNRTISSPSSEFPTNTIFPTLFPFLTGTVANQASAHWNMHFNTLDLELSKQFAIGKWLSLKPKIGLRAAWIKQHFRVKYHSLFVTNTNVFDSNQKFRCNQEFEGIGLKFGNDLQFYMTRAWSILGNLSTSLLWGSTELKERATGLIFISNTNSFPETVDLSRSIDKIRTNLEGQLGLQWQTYYHHGKYRFAASALYSFAYWFSQNHITNQFVTFAPNIQQPAIMDSSTNGDLQMQGLNLQFEFDF